MLDYPQLLLNNLSAVKAAVEAVRLLLLVARRRDRQRRRYEELLRRSTPNRLGKPPRYRHRRSVEQIYACLGDVYFRRAYRMSYASFWVLHGKLHDGIVAASALRANITKQNRIHVKQQQQQEEGNIPEKPPRTGNFTVPPIPNGPVPTSVRLACAIRYFTGASPYDLMVQYGLSYASVLYSVWLVVDAINGTADFHIRYPADHQLQRRIAAEFHEVSEAGFDNCAGAIDGVLIWIHKPSKKDADKSGIGIKKLYCGRKNKFGLNCQAVSDRRGRFLDISIRYGGSSADCLAFEASDLGRRLEGHLLQPGLTLFGDNAYLNSPYMATPYQNVSGGSKDNYNFYHSQVSIDDDG